MPAAVSIEVTTDGAMYGLRMTGHGRPELRLDAVGALRDLARVRQDAVTALLALKRSFGAAADDDARLDALEKLWDEALAFRGNLLNGFAPDMSRAVSEYIHQSLVDWRRSFGSEPLVVLRAPPDAVVPIELLPIPNGAGAFNLRDPLSVGCHRFLGLLAVVTRGLDGIPELSEDRLLHNHPALPVKLFRHQRLNGAEREASFLGGHQGIDLDGPWPDDGADHPTSVETVVTALYDTRQGLSGSSRTRPDQIHHLSCHSEHRDPDRFELLVGRAEGKEVRVTMHDLTVGFNRLVESGRARGPRRRGLPVVILNACGSASVGDYSPASFPRHFMIWRNRAVIGTETAVPDHIAARISRYLYSSLFRGCTLGEALLLARRRLLARDRSALGLLYTLYGDPELQLTHSPRKDG